MDYYGDVSGHFRGVLQGNEKICVVGVVAGDRLSCGRCAKKTVRNVTDIDEAKWNDLLDVQKRRFLECLAQQDHIKLGYAAFTQDHLHSMDNYHLLYQDDQLPIDWDLALTGYAYGEILFEMEDPDNRPPHFEFDRVASEPQCEVVTNHLKKFVGEANVFYVSSHQEAGIQTADCFAGAVAEDLRKDTNWLSYFNDTPILTCRETALIQLESLLHNV